MRALLAVCFVIAIYLGIQGAEGDVPEIHFSLLGATGESYTNFIRALRTQLDRGGTESINGIPILNRNVQPSERFIHVVLTNYEEQSITVGIDVVNVYVLGYRVRARERSYACLLRQDDPSVPIDDLFPGTPREVNFSYTGSYTDLERNAQSRERVLLGLTPLNSAITNMFNNQMRSIPTSFLVIIQMVSEAARFNYLERQIRRAINDNRDYTPGPATLSLENNWGALSTQIQQANLESGAFDRSITLQNIEGRQFSVDNIRNPTIAAIALLLSFQCVPRSNTGGISNTTFVPQPAVDVVLVEEDNSPETCPVRSPTRISGRDGLCVDVRDGDYNNGNSIQLWPCGPKSKQQWTFLKDGTIRSMGKCMTAYGFRSGQYVMIYECGTGPQFKWVLSDDGSITNPHSGLALTAPKATKGTTLLVETNVYAARQGWRAGDDVDPLVSFIMGYADLCMQANNADTEVTMGKCVSGNKQQQWALYNDGTIRVNSVRNLCLTSNGHSFSDVIIIEECKGWGNQRWVFKANGYILNPNDKLVMQVKDNDVSNSQIILGKPTDLPTQKWLPMF